MMSANCRARHGLLLALPILLTGALALPIAAAEHPATHSVPLLDDTRLEQGVIVWSPEAGSHRRQGVLPGLANAGEPVWGLAQWHSRFSLADAAPEPLTAGGLRYGDAAKSITFYPADGPADFALAVSGSVEYEGQAPPVGDPWPHLLVERKLLVQPAVDRLEAVPFAVRYRLVQAQRHTPEGFDERRHTAQFVFYLTVQNLNRESAGYGDYYWFGVPLYDARYRLPRAHKAVDVGSDRKPATGKFIFNPPGEVYTRQSAHDGEWVTIEKDLLPLIREGLETAWQRGYLADSRNRADYHLVAMNSGWEVTGPWDVEMQVAGLRLLAQLRTEEARQDTNQPQQSEHKLQVTAPYPLWNGPALPADPTAIPFAEGIEHRTIHRPTSDGYKFLHGAAIVWHQGQFFANWANSPVDENGRHETLQGRRSRDGGKTWSPLEVIGPGFDGPERHSHGVLFVHEGQVWTIGARFGVGAPGKRFPGLQAEAFVWQPQSDCWTSRGIVMRDCWPYDQPVPLANGSYITGGQNKDGLPCVAISQGADLTRWDTVLLPYPAALAPAFAETTVWADGLDVLAVIRGGGNVAWVATSQDGGRSWAEARPSNLPMPRAKAYLGRLSTGQLYLVSNYKNRDTLVISAGPTGQRQLNRMWRLRHGKSEAPRYPGAAKSKQWSYPYAYEHEGNLFVVYSIGKEECGLTIVPVRSLACP